MPSQPASGGRTPRWMAGGIIAGVGLASLVWWKERDHIARADASASAPVRMAVAAGTRPQTYPLPDGSRVTLAPGSTLESDGVFDTGHRTLALTGEALFTVADGTVPFVVRTSGVQVEDVSTAFVVRSLPAAAGDLPQALVAVTQGEVRVHAAGWHGAVHEGEAVLADSNGVHTRLGHHTVRGGVAWTSGALLFTNEPAIAVVERVERFTGQQIELDPALTAERLSLVIEAESPTATIRHVADALNAQAVSRGGRWVISRR